MTWRACLSLWAVGAIAAGALNGVGKAVAAALNLSQAPVVSQAGYHGNRDNGQQPHRASRRPAVPDVVRRRRLAR